MYFQILLIYNLTYNLAEAQLENISCAKQGDYVYGIMAKSVMLGEILLNKYILS